MSSGLYGYNLDTSQITGPFLPIISVSPRHQSENKEWLSNVGVHRHSRVSIRYKNPSEPGSADLARMVRANARTGTSVHVTNTREVYSAFFTTRCDDLLTRPASRHACNNRASGRVVGFRELCPNNGNTKEVGWGRHKSVFSTSFAGKWRAREIPKQEHEATRQRF